MPYYPDIESSFKIVVLIQLSYERINWKLKPVHFSPIHLPNNIEEPLESGR